MKDNSLYLDEFYKRDCGQKIDYIDYLNGNSLDKVTNSEDKNVSIKLVKISSEKYKKLGL